MAGGNGDYIEEEGCVNAQVGMLIAELDRSDYIYELNLS